MPVSLGCSRRRTPRTTGSPKHRKLGVANAKVGPRQQVIANTMLVIRDPQAQAVARLRDLMSAYPGHRGKGRQLRQGAVKMAPLPAATLRSAETPADIARARELFVEYARWLAVDLCFQGFESELATLTRRDTRLRAGDCCSPACAPGCIRLHRDCAPSKRMARAVRRRREREQRRSARARSSALRSTRPIAAKAGAIGSPKR
jgi:hypothetical protein